MQLGCSFWGLGKLFRAAAETNPCDCAILGTRATLAARNLELNIAARRDSQVVRLHVTRRGMRGTMSVVVGLVLFLGVCCALRWRWFDQSLVVQEYGASR